MNVLALDLATHLGWAIGSPGMNRPRWGSFKLPSTGDNIGRFTLAFSVWLTGFIAEEPVDRIVMEATVLPDKTQRATLLKLYGLAIKVEEIGEGIGIGVSEVRIQSWRKHFLGRASAPPHFKGTDRRKWVKDQAIKSCARRGWLTDDDNEADALGILDYSLCMLSPSYRARTFSLQPQFFDKGAA